MWYTPLLWHVKLAAISRSYFRSWNTTWCCKGNLIFPSCGNCTFRLTEQLAALLLGSWSSRAVQSIADLFSWEGTLKSCKQYQPESLKLLQTAASQSTFWSQRHLLTNACQRQSATLFKVIRLLCPHISLDLLQDVGLSLQGLTEEVEKGRSEYKARCTSPNIKKHVKSTSRQFNYGTNRAFYIPECWYSETLHIGKDAKELRWPIQLRAFPSRNQLGIGVCTKCIHLKVWMDGYMKGAFNPIGPWETFHSCQSFSQAGSCEGSHLQQGSMLCRVIRVACVVALCGQYYCISPLFRSVCLVDLEVDFKSRLIVLA